MPISEEHLFPAPSPESSQDSSATSSKKEADIGNKTIESESKNNTATEANGSPPSKKSHIKSHILPQKTESSTITRKLREITRYEEKKASEELQKKFRTSVPGRDILRATDLGNAERFYEHHKNRVRFSNNSWYIWDGRRWKADHTELVRRLAHSTVKWIYSEGDTYSDPAISARLRKWAHRSENSARISAMLREAQSLPGISISYDLLDPPSTRYLLNCENGTVNVTTGEIKPHDPKDLITRLAPVQYDPNHTGTTFSTFLTEILPDSDTRDFFQRYIGSALTGDTNDQQFIIMHGSGANGKSTLISALLTMFGDYGRQSSFETFLVQPSGRSGARPDLMALRGARFVAAVEAGTLRRLDETTIKSMTGGDSITARELYQGEVSFTPECKIALVSNHLPEIYGNDHAIWRRVLEVPFTVTIPEDKRDTTIRDKLTTATCLTELLGWSVVGAQTWWRKSIGTSTPTSSRLNPSSTMLRATSEYQDEQDRLADFLLDRCTVGENMAVDGLTLWSNYIGYCESSSTRPVGRKTFSILLKDAGFKQVRNMNARVWNGLTLRP